MWRGQFSLSWINRSIFFFMGRAKSRPRFVLFVVESMNLRRRERERESGRTVEEDKSQMDVDVEKESLF